MKICIVCSHGGHLTETLQLLEAFEGHDIFFTTLHSMRDSFVKEIAPVYFMKNYSSNIIRLMVGFIKAVIILRQERPDIIVSLGADVAIPYFVIGKMMRIKSLFIESWCRVEDLSITGKILYPISDRFWVQWPELLEECGKKAEFRGSVI